MRSGGSPLLLLLLGVAFALWGPLLSVSGQSPCQQPPEEGPCDVLGKNWFYDQNTQSCKKFNSGKCGKNLNSFKTSPECLKTCYYTVSP